MRALCAASLLAFAPPCWCQDAPDAYPARPLRLIVPIAPGGGLDLVVRTVAENLAGRLGQKIVIDNRGGASGAIGAEAARRAAPDGHTLLAASATLAIAPLLRSVAFDIERDFIPIALLSTQPYVLVVNAALPVESVAGLIEFVRARPGKLNYASVGAGSQIHLMTELFCTMAGIQAVHVPYKGIASAYLDLVAAHTHFMFGSTTSALPHVKAGRARALAVSGARRAALLPGLPTVAEAGVAGFDVTQWYGLLAPRGTPERIVELLNREVNATLAQADVARRITAEGSEAAGSTPRELAMHIQAERSRWARVLGRIDAAGAR